jgi:hypothetical protein
LKDILSYKNGLIATDKPAHVIEGENTKAYMDHVLEKGAEFAETHK